MGVLKGRNPAIPNGRFWTAFAATGPTGPIGDRGPIGPTGPTGPVAVDDVTAEVFVQPDAPWAPMNPAAELWYDTDDPAAPLGPYDVPVGGTTDQLLTRTADDGPTAWSGPMAPTGRSCTIATITGRDVTVAATMTAPTWSPDVMFDGNISAEHITDRGGSGYVWEEQDIAGLLVYNWHSDLAIGPCRAWRNRYMVLVNLCLGCDPEPSQEVWHDVAQLPPGWQPGGVLWTAAPSIDVQSDGPTTENQITAGGMIKLRVKALNSPDPQRTTRYCIYHCYPRSA